MPRHLRLLLLGATVLLVAGAVSDWYAVAHHLPYAVGGHGRPSRVGQDWPSHGTALGPPLLPFLVLAAGFPLTMWRRWWGGVGDVLLLSVGVAELWGTVAEPSFRAVFTPSGFDAVQVALRVVTLAAAGLVVVAAAADLVGRRRGAQRRLVVSGAG